MTDPLSSLEEIEEIDVTQLLERIATIEKENLENKKVIEDLKSSLADSIKRLIDCEDSIDALAKRGG